MNRDSPPKKNNKITCLSQIAGIWDRVVIPLNKDTGVYKAWAKGIMLAMVCNHPGIITRGTNAPLKNKAIPYRKTLNPQISVL